MRKRNVEFRMKGAVVVRRRKTEFGGAIRGFGGLGDEGVVERLP